ncbi:major facilitator superfamily MFS-1 [Metschnikowia bicuspidata var. bicuspidata NRRL YB-4993]|uniref:Major facilitator superfamily MFS-1 n=1 Tax=Metschnikowia bicuspidata var. bicuspidata NRRL YB-4993 TaxID=869754 RepID=A0A1A0HB05_9ASCO|nr:major facilitator superfamily MFS-1 [Metschnikowia bicuspidata var. bicuspidata NRRL YB-4993]OBA21068.1 major facilitator superfamily MFS-1 [Metschnikowia bicuspidata var. bicuspidata NRRL YB-4993]
MDPRPLILKSPFQEVCFQFTICMAQFLAQGSIAMSLSTMNIISDSFSELQGKQIPSSQTVWFMGSFALTLGTFILISGRLGDLFGLRRMLLFGWFWAALWCVVTGLSYYSKSTIFFITCRAFQGVGFAFILPCAMGILGTVYPPGKRKNLAFAFVGASAPVGATIGVLMAGVVAQLVWWCWAFWLLGIACALLGVLSMIVIPGPFKHHDYTLRQAFEKFDLLGSAVGICGLILFNFVWNQGPVVGWGSPYIIVLLIVSVALIVGFFYLELRVVQHPLLPREIFTLRIGLVLLCMSLGWGSFGIWQYYYWSFLLNLREYTPIAAALTYLPLLILGVAAALLVGFFISKHRAPYIMFASMMGFMLGSTILSISPVQQTFWRLTFAQMFFLAWGMDCSFPAASLILSDFLPSEHQGMAGLLVNTVVNYSVSLFLAMSSTVEVQVKEKTGDMLPSYRGAMYLGVGVSALAVVFSVVFVITEARSHKREAKVEKS